MPVNHKTKNDLSKAVRGKVVTILNARLADATDLALAAKQAHWNVKGPQFYQLHKLFDEVHEVITGHIDMIAERAVQLGGTAEGTLQLAAAGTKLKPYPTTISSGRQHVEALSDRIAAFGKMVCAAINEADFLEDDDTEDLFTEISRDIDKQLWFVEAHLEGTK